MAGKKISELNSITNADLGSTDLVPVVDVTANETKKISVAELDLRYKAATDALVTQVGLIDGRLTSVENQLLDIGITKATGSIANNQSVAQTTGITVNPLAYSVFKIEFFIKRKTDSTEVASWFPVTGIFKAGLNDWEFIPGAEIGDDSGVVLDINASNQIVYTSSNLAGANYSGSFVARVIKL